MSELGAPGYEGDTRKAELLAEQFEAVSSLGESFKKMTTPTIDTSPGNESIKTMFALINAERTAAGLPEVAYCEDIHHMKLEETEMVILPGGLGGVHAILGCKTAMDFLRAAYEAGKYVAAICAAPTILAKLGMTDGRQATCYPGMEHEMGGARTQGCNAVQDGRIITGRAAGAADTFGLQCLRALRGDAAACVCHVYGPKD